MNPFLFLFLFLFLFVILFFAIKSGGQQMYSGNLVMDCDNTDETGPSPAFLYTCNGFRPSCSAFLIFRTQPLYNTVDAISKLMSTDPTELARINNIRDSNKILNLNKEVIIPVTCSCSGKYYQANTSYVISMDENYFTIADSVYQGLTTCDSIQRNNVYDRHNVSPGEKLQVPLRCACPTVSQTTEGTKYLLTYLITWKDSLAKISKWFKVSSQDLALANGFSSGEGDEIYPRTTLLVPLHSEPLSSQTRTLGQKGSLSKKFIIIGTVTGSFLAILCCLFVGYLLWKRNRAYGGEKLKWVLPKDIQLGIASVDQLLKIYRFEELEEATDGFSLQNRLSASVYKGSLRGRTVAIKQMGANAPKEVKILQKFNHLNLIGLYGLCEHDGACYLVYEFMENSSLKQWLEDKTSKESQSWNNRIRIALDVAKGLQYLHNFASPAYVHKDINSSNILLSKDLRAKISKFGLARSTEKDQNKNSSIKCRFESKGYLPPEYLEDGSVTTKTDVYAFGVVLLELIDPRLQAKHTLGFVIDQDELALCLLKLSIACLEPLQFASSCC